jgi:ABC-type glutathione transport system ATPase component
MSELLTVRDLVVSLGRGRARKEILHGVDLTVGAGEIVGLIGETGSGKTTLARTVLGLNRVDRGCVQVAGADVTGLRGARLRAFRLAGVAQYVFQDPLQSLDPDLTLGRSVGEGLEVRGVAGIDERVADALALVGLDPGLAARRPSEVSGGQRQRAAIARAMVLEPRVLLCDEPVSALDASNRVQVLELLQRLRDDQGIGMLFISHDLGSVAGITDRLAVLYRGRIVESGPTEQVVIAPEHPYTRLLLGSAPTVGGVGMSRTERAELRAQLD